jgi:hypothetical protein
MVCDNRCLTVVYQLALMHGFSIRRQCRTDRKPPAENSSMPSADGSADSGPINFSNVKPQQSPASDVLPLELQDQLDCSAASSKVQSERRAFANELRQLISGPGTPPSLPTLLDMHASAPEQCSSDSCNLLLEHAYRTSNLAAARSILAMMAREGLKWDDRTHAIVVRGVMGSHNISPKKDGSQAPAQAVKDMSRRDERWSQVVREAVNRGPSELSDELLVALLRAGPWKLPRTGRRNSPLLDLHGGVDLQRRDIDFDGSPRSHQEQDRQTVRPTLPAAPIQGALSSRDIIQLLPKQQEEMSPDVFVAFMRYVLAFARDVPSPQQSLERLLSVRPTGGNTPVSRRHILDLLHLYLHRRFASTVCRLHIIKFFESNVPVNYGFHPTRETLRMALLSLRRIRCRSWKAFRLIKHFQDRWGAQSVDDDHFRLLMKYAVEERGTKKGLPLRRVRNMLQPPSSADSGNPNRLRQLVQQSGGEVLSDVRTKEGAPTVAFARLGRRRKLWNRAHQRLEKVLGDRQI